MATKKEKSVEVKTVVASAGSTSCEKCAENKALLGEIKAILTNMRIGRRDKIEQAVEVLK